MKIIFMFSCSGMFRNVRCSGFYRRPSLGVVSWSPANQQCREVVLSLPCLHPYSTLNWFWMQCNKTVSQWDKIYWFVRDRSKNVTSLFEKFSLETLHLKMKVLLSNSENREHLKMSWMLIVYWPITMKFRIRKQTSKPQTYYRCCLRFSYLSTYWLISCNTINSINISGVHAEFFSNVLENNKTKLGK